MKKIVYLIILISGLIASSQQTATAQVVFGVRGGVNFATITGDNIDADTRTGFLAGVYTRFRIQESPVSIQPELLYSQKGAENNGSGDGADITVTTKLDYIEIPVLVRLGFATSGSITPHVYAGPYLGFNINAKAEAGGNNQDIDNIKTTDFGITVGAGVDIGVINVGVRYEAGLTNIADNNGAGDAKNSVFSIIAGIEF